MTCALAATSVMALAGCGSSSNSDTGSSSASTDAGAATQAGSKDPIVVGISAAKTGIYQPYDEQASQLLQMRFDEINKDGGVLGRPIRVEWIDTKSEKPTAGTNAQELIDKGAKVIVATCDFDYSFPAIQAASTQKVPAMALCASSPKSASPALVGPYSGTMGLGSDTEGVAMANWLHENHPDLKRAYVITDTFIQYSKATAAYFAARWKELGGTICGEDSFVGGPTLDLSSQVTRLRSKVSGCDVVYDSSIIPFGAQLIRGIRDAGIDLPIATNAAVNGTAIKQVAGNVSDVYALGFACVDTYCKGGNAAVADVNARFEDKYGAKIASSYALPGYDLATAIAAAIEKAGSTDGDKIAAALFDSGITVDELSGNKVQFTSECHRPQPGAYSVEEFKNGQSSQVGTASVDAVPDIGDGNTCTKPPAVK
ncbi:ABC transporter substrate-binding protein [Capillimicrobium parvum]|uniref:ABC transporter substrate-binding protein n=1 Tax=Capillimicrobium parvum TaxID=2884022 RepID=UPI00216ACE44|nr:ABC transporter substrate-binding protein [Capillimicrobium parvum]